jgi:hypothetical protein
MRKQLILLLGIVVATFTVVAAFSQPASAVPSTGCPVGYQLRSVESLAAQGNAPVPALVDAAGNGDGFVCAHALPDAVCVAHSRPNPCPVETVFVFKDNRTG